MVCRAGRGALGSEAAIQLNDHYTIDFRYPVYLYFCRGASLPAAYSIGQYATISTPSGNSYQVTFDSPMSLQQLKTQTQVLADRGELFSNMTKSGLDISSVIMLENAWLGGFKVSDLNYEGSRVVTIESTIYAENIFQMTDASAAKNM